ncbi:MAG: peptidase inhibitor family I36 protein [Hyphomicrobiaceae bacterium]|nr:peptidase inhibitor family I36 protein [Hyphomicrobiaceae bacterium]MCC0023254.1 peptidase inhibitor family I36 protein [Hyphomicrobiaceae bacterium]
MRFLGNLAALFLVVGSLFAGSSAFAEGLGSRAHIISATDLYKGPGTGYAVSGAVTAGQDVIVTRCSGLWCLLDDEGGWIAKQNVSFGQHAGGLLQGPRFIDGRAADGTICFYDGAGFSGNGFCLDSGNVLPDLLLVGWDNKISSVSVDPGTSVTLCRDRNFASYCVRVDRDMANLPRLIDNSASSIQMLSPRPF